MFSPLDLDDALHPLEGPDPAQPPLPLGAAADGPDATSGTPPMIIRRLSIAAWHAYIADYPFPWKLPSRIVLHHTWKPTPETWRGVESMRAMQRYYADKGWSSCPHVYCAPDGIWLAAPLSRIGIHAGRGNGSVAEGWYSIGVEMVGDFDQARPAGAVWDGTRAVLAGLRGRINRPLASILSFHRDYSTKSCPGHAVTRDWVLSQVAEPGLGGGARYSAESPLLATYAGNTTALIAAFSRRCATSPDYSPSDREAIGGWYAQACAQLGLDLAIVLAQVCHETANLSSALSQRHDRDGRPLRNPAGIGVTGVSSQLPLPGFVWDADRGVYRACVGFRAWATESIPAHVGRLIAYATRPDQRTAEQQAAVNAALAFRPLQGMFHGTAPVLRMLGKVHNPFGAEGAGWAAPGTDYGARLAAVANSLSRGGA